MCKRFFFLLVVVTLATTSKAQSPFILSRLNAIFDAFARVTATQAQSQSQSRLFFTQLTAILAAGEAQHFAGIKGKLLNTSENGQKIYECTLLLEGFRTAFTEEKTGLPEFYAASVSNPASIHVRNLTNDVVRELDGMPGYINHDNTTEQFIYAGANAEAVTMLTKKESAIRLFIYKLPGQAGFILITK